MRWPAALAALVARLEGDAELVAALGGEPRIYPAEDPHAASVPSVWWQRVSEPDAENWEEPLIQWSWLAREADAVTIERRLRALLYAEVAFEVGGVWLIATLEDVRSFPGEQTGTVEVQMDIRYVLERLEE